MTVTSVPVRLLKPEYAIRTREFFLGVGKNFNDTKTSIDPSRAHARARLVSRDRIMKLSACLSNEQFRVMEIGKGKAKARGSDRVFLRSAI